MYSSGKLETVHVVNLVKPTRKYQTKLYYNEAQEKGEGQNISRNNHFNLLRDLFQNVFSLEFSYLYWNWFHFVDLENLITSRK